MLVFQLQAIETLEFLYWGAGRSDLAIPFKPAQFSSKNNTLDIQQEGKAMLDAAGTLAGQMIVAQSELEGLRQIYPDNNHRVRSLNARVVELRKQLEKFGGEKASRDRDVAPAEGLPADLIPASGNGLPYPTIHSLPLLGAKYVDYHRRAKIQETVYKKNRGKSSAIANG